MGGKLSCVNPKQTEDKKDKGSRLHDFTEISDDTLTSGNVNDSTYDGYIRKHDDNVEELYENSSSIMRASMINAMEHKRRCPSKSTSNRRHSSKSGDNRKSRDIPLTNGKVDPKIIPESRDGAKKRNTEKNNSKPIEFHIEESSKIGDYQNVHPAFLKTKQPSVKNIGSSSQKQQPEKEEDDCMYAQVQKPKKKKSTSATQQLNYVEVEFLPKSFHEERPKSEKKEQSRTAYTDVIHKDGKVVLVT